MGFKVGLSVYDVTNASSDQANNFVVKLNNITHQLGMGGVFHGAIAIEGLEWSFGYCDSGTGVYCCEEKQNPMYYFRETVDLGETPKTKQQVKDILQRLKREWLGSSYELLSRNCCHFCYEFAKELDCKDPPAWLNRFAQGADATITFTNEAVQMAKSVGSNISKTAAWLRDSVSKMWGDADKEEPRPGKQPRAQTSVPIQRVRSARGDSVQDMMQHMRAGSAPAIRHSFTNGADGLFSRAALRELYADAAEDQARAADNSFSRRGMVNMDETSLMSSDADNHFARRGLGTYVDEFGRASAPASPSHAAGVLTRNGMMMGAEHGSPHMMAPNQAAPFVREGYQPFTRPALAHSYIQAENELLSDDVPTGPSAAANNNTVGVSGGWFMGLVHTQQAVISPQPRQYLDTLEQAAEAARIASLAAAAVQQGSAPVAGSAYNSNPIAGGMGDFQGQGVQAQVDVRQMSGRPGVGSAAAPRPSNLGPGRDAGLATAAKPARPLPDLL
mmetsp:Transcript_21317/g.46558  ORF Transcript_21317/g.46558 Transcript_21317/m.46558 type:complete len:502 (-) Transcript_21317:1317-2822(-)|eukprot:CAMPEP_0202906334 /NCGR_PEP_ID=MMETSP1392-20130828/38418_1 /ASSEMBLY_ACC=CAM_ASM_000868 /TAXON_ID=225041 /ORGANISM="Chlamydomonas chlamydogama, Strain SAG 11-48b" /LENGTH=501 /DNA_ID=CAMNT_0049594797 /DNA_START=200 /DNA_END=1705 /DNA_ORIENTATION=+